MKSAAEESEWMTVPEAGKLYYGLGRDASYAAAHRGDIPVIRIGKLFRVPVVAVKRQFAEAGRKEASK